jgi:hypothetical protein
MRFKYVFIPTITRGELKIMKTKLTATLVVLFVLPCVVYMFYPLYCQVKQETTYKVFVYDSTKFYGTDSILIYQGNVPHKIDFKHIKGKK